MLSNFIEPTRKYEKTKILGGFTLNSSNNMALIAENVEKRYKTNAKEYMALRGIDLKINKRDFAAIIGKSGSGKSTLLNLFGGIDRPTKGEIIVAGKNINRLKENQLSSLRSVTIGFIFQFFQLMPTLTVLENVLLPMAFCGRILFSQRKKRAMILLDKVGMKKYAHKFPSELSGGEQQRVAIARALSNNPKIILADEPTGNLDSRTAEDIFRLLKSLNDEGKSIVMVTHSIELAEQCGRIIHIQDGAIIDDYYTRGK